MAIQRPSRQEAEWCLSILSVKFHVNFGLIFTFYFRLPQSSRCRWRCRNILPCSKQNHADKKDFDNSHGLKSSSLNHFLAMAFLPDHRFSCQGCRSVLYDSIFPKDDHIAIRQIGFWMCRELMRAVSRGTCSLGTEAASSQSGRSFHSAHSGVLIPRKDRFPRTTPSLNLMEQHMKAHQITGLSMPMSTILHLKELLLCIDMTYFRPVRNGEYESKELERQRG